MTLTYIEALQSQLRTAIRDYINADKNRSEGDKLAAKSAIYKLLGHIEKSASGTSM